MEQIRTNNKNGDNAVLSDTPAIMISVTLLLSWLMTLA
jgi:hypothetical protein